MAWREEKILAKCSKECLMICNSIKFLENNNIAVVTSANEVNRHHAGAAPKMCSANAT